jgi:hypothetical protein
MIFYYQEIKLPASTENAILAERRLDERKTRRKSAIGDCRRKKKGQTRMGLPFFLQSLTS